MSPPCVASFPPRAAPPLLPPPARPASSNTAAPHAVLSQTYCVPQQPRLGCIARLETPESSPRVVKAVRAGRTRGATGDYWTRRVACGADRGPTGHRVTDVAPSPRIAAAIGVLVGRLARPAVAQGSRAVIAAAAASPIDAAGAAAAAVDVGFTSVLDAVGATHGRRR